MEGGNGKRTHSKEKLTVSKSQSQEISREEEKSRKSRHKERREEEAEPLERPQHKARQTVYGMCIILE